jgi:peptidyl-prolyl cis-trans isomerase C
VSRTAPAAHLALLAALAGAACLAGCGRCGVKPAPGKEAPRPVAIVNGEPITAEAIQRELTHVRATGGEGEAPDGVLKRRILDDAIERALLLEQARERSIAVGQDQVERALLRLRADYPGTHFDDLLAQEKLSQAELKARLREQLTIEKLFADEVFPRVQLTEAEVERYYTEHAQEFEQPEQVHAFQIVVRTQAEAQKLRGELRRRPQSFGEVARRASIAPEGKVGGDLGWFGKGSGMPEVFDACFRLPLNALSEVTPSPYGFHLFKVVARKPPNRQAFAEARELIHDRLLRERRAHAQQEYLAALRKRAKIEVDQAALDGVTP